MQFFIGCGWSIISLSMSVKPRMYKMSLWCHLSHSTLGPWMLQLLSHLNSILDKQEVQTWWIRFDWILHFSFCVTTWALVTTTDGLHFTWQQRRDTRSASPSSCTSVTWTPAPWTDGASPPCQRPRGLVTRTSQISFNCGPHGTVTHSPVSLARSFYTRL